MKTAYFNLIFTFLFVSLSTTTVAKNAEPVAVKVAIPEAKLARVKNQFKQARFPDTLYSGGWEAGSSESLLAELRDYIVNEYDWRGVESKLNAHPQFKVDIEGHSIQYYHVKGEGKNPTPLILTHGWPGSVFEFLHLIEPLTQPSKFGGKAEDAFTVVIPSMPGFGWSKLNGNKPIGPATTAKLWHLLMQEVLGYQHYGAQGGDLGSLVSSHLASKYPESLIGVHMNIIPWAWKPVEQQTPEEKAWFAKGQQFQKAQFDYFFMQAQEPSTVAFALHDNPLGIAAWITDKMYAWVDHKGELKEAISLDDIATFVMIYALTDTIDTSVWFYQGVGIENGQSFHPSPGTAVTVPTAFANFPKDLPNAMPPRSWVEQQYNIKRWTDMPRGGHFAAFEEPELFVDDVRAFFRQLNDK
jgi:microsomal epoxide hydrolase